MARFTLLLSLLLIFLCQSCKLKPEIKYREVYRQTHTTEDSDSIQMRYARQYDSDIIFCNTLRFFICYEKDHPDWFLTEDGLSLFVFHLHNKLLMDFDYAKSFLTYNEKRLTNNGFIKETAVIEETFIGRSIIHEKHHIHIPVLKSGQSEIPAYYEVLYQSGESLAKLLENPMIEIDIIKKDPSSINVKGLYLGTFKVVSRTNDANLGASY